MSGFLKVDFRDGDGNEDENVVACTICGEKGVRVKTMSDDTTAFEHVILYERNVKRDRMKVVSGCFRQRSRRYK